METRFFTNLFLLFFAYNGVLANEECSNVPEPLIRLAHGVDITTLTLLPWNGLRPDGFRGKVFEYKCVKNVTWKDPNTNEVFRIPDQVMSFYSTPGSWQKIVSKVYGTGTDMRRSMAETCDIEYVPGMFSSSSVFEERIVDETVRNRSMKLAHLSMAAPLFRVDFSPRFIYGTGYNLELMKDGLPSNFTAEPEPFYEFIREFGTHVFARASLGGAVQGLFRNFESFVWSEEKLAKESAKQFLSLMQDRGVGNFGRESVSERFEAESEHQIEFYGPTSQNGGPSLVGSPWRLDESVKSSWILSGSLTPISEVIYEGSKKKQLNLAVEAYLDKAYLRELKNFLESSFVPFKYDNSSVSLNLSRALRNESEKQIPDHSVTKELGRRIEYELLVPNWWNEVKFCFNFHADGDTSQCVGPSNEICAFVGESTRTYTDRTNSKKGSCFMSWGLKAPFYIEDWFRNVEICFRHTNNTKSNFSQTCAPVNSFTLDFRDDSGESVLANYESWMMKVPGTSPIWLLKKKICFFWYGGLGCGGDGLENQLCANVNEWTSYYKDSTEDGSSGCHMSWSIMD